MTVLAATAVLTLCTLTAAQVQRTFEVSSVKRNTSSGGLPPIVAVTGTRLSAPFVTARELIRVAYGVDDNQIVGGPDWLNSDRFEVNATSPPGASLDDIRAMLRTLLADRFGLQAHTEKRDLPVDALTFSGKFGPKMRETGPACTPPASPPGINLPPPPPPPPAGAAAMIVLGQPPGPRCALIVVRGYISARAIAMDAFVAMLVRELQRPVIDRTMLSGQYDIDLSYLPDSGPMTINGQAINADAPSLATAVREQLGMKLDSTRAPVDVVVIERLNAPREN